jgi:uncharacterized protein
MLSIERIIIRLLVPCLLMVLAAVSGCSDPDRPTIAFHLALQRGDIDQIERHIFWGADINQAGPNGQTPLHVAADKGRPIITELLLKHGADMEGTDGDGNTPMHTAVMSGRTQVAELLIRQGARFEKDRLLMDSVRNNITDRDVIRMLLLKGADINHFSTDGVTPLLEAIHQGNRVLVKLLITNGSDVNLASTTGQTPLQLAEQKQDSSIIRLLEINGAIPTQRP